MIKETSVTSEVLNHLWQGGGYTYYWTDKGRQSHWFPAGQPACVPADWKNSNVYFGIHPCAEIPKVNASGEPKAPAQIRSQIKLISAINCLFGEYDAKDEVYLNEYAVYLPDNFEQLTKVQQNTAVKNAKESAVSVDRAPYKHRAMDRIQAAPLAPSLLIDSGGGYHAYWFLSDTVLVDDTNRSHIQAIQAAWVDLIGCDPVSKDMARVLRVPGTKNVKPHYAPDYPTVTVIEHEPSRLFSLSDFERLIVLDDVGVAATKAAKKTQQADKGEPVDDVIAEFNRTHKIVDMLTAKGYTLGWERPEVARMARPGRVKDQTSVIVFKAGDKEMSYHHSSSDELYTVGHCRDAFDIETHFEHAGDAKKAYEATKKAQGKWTEEQARQIIDPDTGEIVTLSKVRSSMNGTNGHHAAVFEYTKGGNMADDNEAPQAEQPEKKPKELSAKQMLLKEGAHDEGNAQCVHVRYKGKFLHSESLGWLVHTGTHWTMDEAEAKVERAITETLIARLNAAIKEEMSEERIKKFIPNSGRVQGAKSQLRSLVSVVPEKFDIEADYLNCKNGVVDLRTGEVIEHSPGQRFMHCTAVNYNPKASQDLWWEWLIGAVGLEMADWLQIAVGYTLTGHTREEIMFYLFGPPRSGKGTFTETLLNLLGSPLAKEVGFSMFLAQRTGDSQNFDLAPLKPCRFVAASESNSYERFNEAKIKALTGGNEVYCAFKHKTHFGYKPQFKIWLSSNQPINADPDDEAVWGRLRVVEFPHSHLGHEDKSLKYNMRSNENLEGVLAWAVDGAKRWYALGTSGLPEVAGSAKTKQAHRSELDNVQAWIDENCEKSDVFCAYSSLYYSYETWCKNNGVEPKKQKGFSQALIHKGYQNKAARVDDKVVKGFMGLRIR